MLSSLKYRPELDGLRAVAILGVFAFHLFPEHLSGGFLGVDVFFVLSGFLISSLIVNSQSNNTFSFLDFFIRRARRLVPALLLAVVITLITAGFLFTPEHLEASSQSGFFGAIGLANIHFWLSADYFDLSETVKPFIHYWSLGVEEQFYLFWPMLLYICGSLFGVRTRLSLILVLTVISFLAMWVFQTSHFNAIFYLMPFRIWEFGAGASLALVMISRAGSQRTMPAHLSTLAVAIGLSLILASYLIGSQFHNLAIQILPAVIGTLLIIAAGGNGLSDLVLANPISIILGKISYSLYLYHWPVIVFLLYVFGVGNNVTPIISLAAISLSVLLAYLSYKFVETPYRKAWTKSVKTERIAVPALLISMIAVVMFSAGHIWQHEGLKWRLNAEQRAIVDATLRPRLSCDRREFNGSKDLLCVFGAKKNKIDVAVIGDSHARVLAAGLSKIFEQEGLTGVLINKGGMPPLMNTHTHLTGGVGFEGNSNEYFQTIIDTDPEYILMHARYALYWTTLGTPVEPELKARFLGPIEGDFEYSISKTQEQFQKGLIETIEAIKDAGITPIIVGPVPNPGVNIKQCLSRPYSRNIELILESCGGYSQEDSLKRNAEVTSLINQITKDNGAKFYDPTPIFCKLDEPYCSRLIQDRVLYYDDDHLSLVGSRVLGKRVFSFIDEDKIDD